MANRLRNANPPSIDQENIHSKVLQTKALAKPLTRRPALDELGNKGKPNKVAAPLKRTESIKKVESIYDPDEETKDNPEMVAEYINDIVQYLRESESKFEIREKYITSKHQFTYKMRGVLVDWLVQVHTTFKLTLETLHLAVGILDLYLQDRPDVNRDNMQLVGTTALFIASKYEETYVQDIGDFVFISDSAHSRRDILKMERIVLKQLDFRLGKPLSIHFLRRYSKVAKVSMDEHNLGKYLLELALIDYSLCHVKPSIIAAAACCLAMAILRGICPALLWTATLRHFSSFGYLDLKPAIAGLAQSLINMETETKNLAVKDKYSHRKYNKISLNCNITRKTVLKLVGKSN